MTAVWGFGVEGNLLTEIILTAALAGPANLRIDEVRRDWAVLQPHYFDGPYKTYPDLKAPFATGSLNSDFYRDGFNFLVFVRKLAGLPADLETKPELDDKAQHGAVMLSQMSAIAHQGALPQGMDMDFYSLASQGLKQGNISRQTGSAANLPQLLFDQMWDNRENAPHVGHRRWILNPRLKYVGLGFVSYEGGNKNDGVCMAHDTSRPDFPYHHVAWPAAGDFPLEFCPQETPWSVTLDPKSFQPPVPGQVDVVVKEKNPSETFKFHPVASDQTADQKYFSVINLQNYGVPNAIIFRLPMSHEYKAGDEYEVTITGLKSNDGQPASLSYSVTLFSLTSGN